MSKNCTAPECVLDVLVAAGGMDRKAAASWALEWTCFPMDCATAAKQAREYMADPVAYYKRWQAQLEDGGHVGEE